MALELNQLILIMSFSFAIWTCLSLLRAPSVLGGLKVPLVFFTLLLSLPLLNGYLSMSNALSIEWLNRLSQNLTLAYGPLLWLLVQRLMLKPASGRFFYLHLLPWFAVNVLAILEVPWISLNGFLCLLGLQVSAYCILAVRVLSAHTKGLKRLLIEFKYSSYFWFACVSVVMMLTLWWDIAIWMYVSMTDQSPNSLLLGYAACGLTLVVAILAGFGISQPKWLYTGQKEFDSEVLAQSQSDSLDEAIDNKKPRQIELSPEVASILAEKLESLVRDYQLYQDTELTLDKLAALLGISRNQLSELLNVHLQQSFYDYLNEFRFDASIGLLKTQASGLSILDIAYQAGFNNKNSFYTVFKRKTGMTPNQYRKQSGS